MCGDYLKFLGKSFCYLNSSSYAVRQRTATVSNFEYFRLQSIDMNMLLTIDFDGA